LGPDCNNIPGGTGDRGKNNARLGGEVSGFTAWVTGNWEEIKAFFNSVFFTSIAGSLAGAFFGAYAAQRIAERGKYRDQLLKELRDTNAAITLAASICNSLLSMKKQHIKGLKEQYDAGRKSLDEFMVARRAGRIAPNVEFRFDADLQTLTLPAMPADILQVEVLEKISARARPIALTTTLRQSLNGLGEMLEKRNHLIESYKASGKPLSPANYFGLPQGGNVNADYPSALHGIYSQTNDGIFFSHLLMQDLMDHGTQTAREFKKRFGKGAPQVRKADFTKAAQDGLMPNPDDYKDWMTMFKPPEAETNTLRRAWAAASARLKSLSHSK
jgi:hypothetical protein